MDDDVFLEILCSINKRLKGNIFFGFFFYMV